MKKINFILVGQDNLFADLGEGEKQIQTTKENPLNQGTKEAASKSTEGNQKEEDEDESENVTISKSLLESLVMKITDGRKSGSSLPEGDLAEAIREITATINRNSGRRVIGATPMDDKNIDIDDVMPVPAMFFAHSVRYTLYDDTRNGRVILPPYGGAFRFKKIERHVDASNAKRPTYISVSACYVYSKKEYEWLKKHSHFGIKFFENTAEARAMSTEKQEALAFAMGAVSRYDDHQVVQSCLQEKIAVDTSDVSVLRKRLVEKRSEAYLKGKRALEKNALSDLETFEKIKTDLRANQTY